MKTVTGVVLGLVGYAAWRLSEPEPGESAEFSARIERLKDEWRRATEQGKAAGETRRKQMEQEFDSIFKKG
ncbi:MAG TPA: hypothetical protein VG815_12015 [Chloroflexota bacterium]|jgi:hypothetical protein|nr:hypothetical protein [Chloroflexota bacterium]